MNEINPFCLSSYLAFRYVCKNNVGWLPGIVPNLPSPLVEHQTPVSTPDAILETLQLLVNQVTQKSKTIAIFLSGGIDSAILAALLPEGTNAYTIHFEAESSANEVEFAKKYALKKALNHVVVRVAWEDYEKYEEKLMINKKAPLHPVEVALYKASLMAANDGVESVFLGNGADSTFGGLDGLLAKDWSFDEFVQRYTFIQPDQILKRPVDILEIYEPYRKQNKIDYLSFLKYVHGTGIIQAFNNAVMLCGLKMEEPFEMMKLDGELDLARIRRGEPKYLLQEVFKKLYPDIEPPRKIPFARPMEEWLCRYPGPNSEVFKNKIDIAKYSGDQKYLIHSLDKFLSIIEKLR